MGQYTALDNPTVDQMIQNHLEQILAALTARVAPQAVILYGSTARGEASVLVEGEHITMLSDYELSVVGRSPRLRRLLAALSRQMTQQLGVSTGINWMRPGRLWTNHTKNLAFGRATPSIFMYELKSAGRVIYGQDLLRVCPPIHPTDIPLTSGIALLLNRLAEALAYLPCASEPHARLDTLMWINKVVLACADALLLSAGQYHYSYAERGRRFAQAGDAFAPLIAQVPAMPALVERAVEFKLRPRLDLYPDDLCAVWREVGAMADVVFRRLVYCQYGQIFDTYAEYPAQHLALLHRTRSSRLGGGVSLFRHKLVEGLKHVDQRRWPPPVFRTRRSPAQVVYALTPVVFQSCFSEQRGGMLSEARRWLALLGPLEPPSADWQTEWNHLRQCLVWNWRVFCY
jgi:predicted nucleotidyltransferase